MGKSCRLGFLAVPFLYLMACRPCMVFVILSHFVSWAGCGILATTWQNQQSGCAASEDSDQPGHPPSLIRVFAVRMKKAWVLSYPLSAQRRLWIDWVDAQADLCLRWAHTHFAGFVILWLIWLYQFLIIAFSSTFRSIHILHTILEGNKNFWFLREWDEMVSVTNEMRWCQS